MFLKTIAERLAYLNGLEVKIPTGFPSGFPSFSHGSASSSGAGNSAGVHGNAIVSYLAGLDGTLKARPCYHLGRVPSLADGRASR